MSTINKSNASVEPTNNIHIGDVNSVSQMVNTLLLGDIRGSVLSQTATMTIAAPGVVTSNSHGMATGDKFYFVTTGALPTGVSASTTYYAANVAANTFNISTSLANAVAGTYVTTTGSQSGTHTLFTGGLVLTSGVKGTVTNDSATAGYVGQIIEQFVLRANAQTLSTSTDVPVLNTALTLTPGMWMLTGYVGFRGTATTVAQYGADISTGSTTPGAPPLNPFSAADSRDGYATRDIPPSANLGNGDIIKALPTNFVSIGAGGTQTMNLIARSVFSGGGNTMLVWGRLSAIRVR